MCSSTPRRTSSSCRLRLRVSPASSVGSTSTARRRFPATSSAMRCCRSAGVSVHSDVSALRDGCAVRANCRGRVSFVGSIATGASVPVGRRPGEGDGVTYIRGGRTRTAGRASTLLASRLSASTLPNGDVSWAWSLYGPAGRGRRRTRSVVGARAICRRWRTQVRHVPPAASFASPLAP